MCQWCFFFFSNTAKDAFQCQHLRIYKVKQCKEEKSEVRNLLVKMCSPENFKGNRTRPAKKTKDPNYVYLCKI